MNFFLPFWHCQSDMHEATATVLRECPFLSEEEQLVILQVDQIGQAGTVFAGFTEDGPPFRDLLSKLICIHRFYREMGGIVGYQEKVLELLRGDLDEKFCNAQFHSPSFLDISKTNAEVEDWIAFGIDAMPHMAEIYPLGGAADRLHLVENGTGRELPAAKLPFAGKTLLEHLIRDLEARERIHYEKHGVRLTTPIAIMTSHEKNNHAHVVQICEESNYFGRPKESIRFFTQPLVPAVTVEGNWCMSGPLNLVLKPNGHGAIWKLARDEGIFSWLEQMGRTKCLIRQINNPIAGLDYGLLAFIGIGCKQKMFFGFASAPRFLQSAEGVNVIVEKDSQIVLTNIEYCDFHKFGIEDLPLVDGEPYSRFSSNTNILFADLKAISEAIDLCPFPGLLVNLKKGSFQTALGEKREAMMARLESTMQNIADVFVEEKKGCGIKTEKTFVTYNLRHKTISSAKKAYVPSGKVQDTPENCFYDLLFAHRELLYSCGFQLPKKKSIDAYLQEGPEFLFLYHPALGPLYSKIREKLQEGVLGEGSELLLEIANLSVKKIKLNGSLQIQADTPIESSCVLENVTIENRGVDWSSSSPFWRMDLKRHETVKIVLKGKSRFIARNAHLKGNHLFVVEDGMTVEV